MPLHVGNLLRVRENSWPYVYERIERSGKEVSFVAPAEQMRRNLDPQTFLVIVELFPTNWWSQFDEGDYLAAKVFASDGTTGWLCLDEILVWERDSMYDIISSGET